MPAMQGIFTSALSYASGGSSPESVTVGDFNGDGKSDLAVANAASNNVGVLLGNGTGGFAAAVTYASGGSSPCSVTVGDFNADGKSDLAVANAYSDNVGVLLGNGAGGFAAAVTYASGGSRPVGHRGRFQRRRKDRPRRRQPDSNNVGVLLGNGAGGFAAAVTYASGGSGPISVTVGDFNADGKSDLAVANVDRTTSASCSEMAPADLPPPSPTPPAARIPYSVTRGRFQRRRKERPRRRQR